MLRRTNSDAVIKVDLKHYTLYHFITLHLAVPEKEERGKVVTGQNKEELEYVFTSGSLLAAGTGGEELTNNECPG